MRAKKSLGQHFLTSEKALSQIIEGASLMPTDIVLEIGPGQGVLTERLLARAKKVITIEKDRDLIPHLSERFSTELQNNQLELLEADVLTVDPRTLARYPSYKLVANIPYYITGAIIEKFLSTPHTPLCMVLLMQKEVAERIVARDHKESILSIAVKAYGTPRIIGKVPPGAFVPPPTVDSAILLVEGITRDFFIDPQTHEVLCDEALFFTVLKALFGKKRKQMGGSLAELMGNRRAALEALAHASIDPTTRPEDVSLETWRILTRAIGDVQKSVV